MEIYNKYLIFIFFLCQSIKLYCCDILYIYMYVCMYMYFTQTLVYE